MSRAALRGSSCDVALLSEQGTHGTNDDVVRVVHPVPDETLCLVADGLGGHNAGQLAATIAVETIVQATDGAPLERARLTELVAMANDAIVEAQGASPGLSRMRTTLVLLHLDATSAFWLHCGDSRLYLVRDGTVLARTFDHSLAQMQAGTLDGESGTRASVSRHALLRSLGSSTPGESRPRAVRDSVSLADKDRFLLCSDGFWEGMDHELLGSPVADVNAWLDMLHRSSDTGAVDRDDASAIAIERVSESSGHECRDG